MVRETESYPIRVWLRPGIYKRWGPLLESSSAVQNFTLMVVPNHPVSLTYFLGTEARVKICGCLL